MIDLDIPELDIEDLDPDLEIKHKNGVEDEAGGVNLRSYWIWPRRVKLQKLSMISIRRQGSIPHSLTLLYLIYQMNISFSSNTQAAKSRKNQERGREAFEAKVKKFLIS